MIGANVLLCPYMITKQSVLRFLADFVVLLLCIASPALYQFSTSVRICMEKEKASAHNRWEWADAVWSRYQLSLTSLQTIYTTTEEPEERKSDKIVK